MIGVRWPLLLIACLLTTLLAPFSQAQAAAKPVWWDRAHKIALKDHYGLLTTRELRGLLDSNTAFLLLDVRTVPEFKQGHLPKAQNLEFSFADQSRLSKEKEAAFLSILGPNPKRLIVIYDRSLQCVRSEIAAKWAAALGYQNIKRYPEGWHGWVKASSKGKGPATAKGLTLGDPFPDPSLTILPGGDDRRYLGLPPKQKAFKLSQLKGDIILLVVFHEFCLSCHEQLEILGKLRRKIASGKPFSRPLLILGLGAGSQNRQIVRFRRKHHIEIPLFADRESRLFHELGDPLLPALYLLQVRGKSGPTLVSDFCGGKIGQKELEKRIRAALAH